MIVAQKLYEAGFITYMRTDSVNLSKKRLLKPLYKKLQHCMELIMPKKDFIVRKLRVLKRHMKQLGPHICTKKTIDAEGSHQKLYNLIWKRTISSQMTDATFDRTNIKISLSNTEEKFIAKGEVITFEGFMKVYLEGKDDDNEVRDGVLPNMKNGEILKLVEAVASEQFTRPPARFAEASLVKMEELGIGRPSTYASTITTIQKRSYVENESKDGEERVSKLITLKQGNIQEAEKKIFSWS